MPRIPESFLDEIRNRVDIVELVSEYVHLKRSGRNYFGLCPFHAEKTPSFSVSPEKQIFHCFGCGVGGNVITFMMEIENLDFVEAVRVLARKAGLPFPEPEGTEGETRADRERVSMREAYQLAARFYQYLLMHTDYGERARTYLRQRGVADDTITAFQLGYAPDAPDAVAKFLARRKFSLPLMEKAGLVFRSASRGTYVDRFRRRVMFPICDGQGQVVAFGGRIIGEGEPKYLNSPETPLFQKSALLFNLHRARKAIRKKQQVVLMEGYLDVVAAHQAGVENAVATLGTALSPEQARILRRNAEQVVICYDGDDAGMEAARKAGLLLREAGCLVKVALLPDGMDPDDVIRERGAAHFRDRILGEAVSFMAFTLRYLRKGRDLRDEVERMRYIRDCLAELAQVPSAVERDHYLRQLAEEFHLSLDALKREQWQVYKRLKAKAQRVNLASEGNTSRNPGGSLVVKPTYPAFQNAERMLLALMMRDASVARLVQEKIGDAFNLDQHAALAAYLYAYYASGNEPDPGRFLQTLRDEALLELASELAMLEGVETVDERQVHDCIRRVLDYPLEREIARLKEAQREAERAGDPARAAAIGTEIIALKRRMKSGEALA